MRRLLLAFLSAVVTAALAAEAPTITPAEAARLVARGEALLVDVREPDEWQEAGVAAPAVLLPKSDFDGPQKEWKPFLAALGHKSVVLYCRSGHRAGQVGAALAAKGFHVANAGGFKDWAAAGLPIRRIETPPPKPTPAPNTK